jgi:homoserine O-acetyltransferase
MFLKAVTSQNRSHVCKLLRCVNRHDSSSAAISPKLRTSFRAFGAAASDMEDEYGIMEASKEAFNVPSFTLESGVTLENVNVNYKTYGTLNPAKDNVMVVCHALTGSAALDSWWGALLGDGKPFDTSKYFVVCANVLGSCYGTTGPTSINPSTNKHYGSSFPLVTVRDSVRLHMQLILEEIGANKVQEAVMPISF